MAGTTIPVRYPNQHLDYVLRYNWSDIETFNDIYHLITSSQTCNRSADKLLDRPFTSTQISNTCLTLSDLNTTDHRSQKKIGVHIRGKKKLERHICCTIKSQWYLTFPFDTHMPIKIWRYCQHLGHAQKHTH